GLPERIRKTTQPELLASVPSSLDPPINKVIESAKEHPIKQELFNKIRPAVDRHERPKPDLVKLDMLR
ncbi:MAG: hypothetical protein ABJI41_07555, partial [Erythrobacter sp.]